MLNGPQLNLDRCPYCGIAKPYLQRVWNTATNRGVWVIYNCQSCGGLVLANSDTSTSEIASILPAAFSVDDAIPARAREYLTQAASSLHAPSGAVVLAASSVDSMLKDKGFKDGVLNTRINEAATAHLITKEMADWAHEVRLDANFERHADETVALPTAADAQRVIEFAQALGQFLYVLPAMVAKGRKAGAPPAQGKVGGNGGSGVPPMPRIPGTS